MPKCMASLFSVALDIRLVRHSDQSAVLDKVKGCTEVYRAEVGGVLGFDNCSLPFLILPNTGARGD
jgi:hypothetical protein